MDVCRSYGAYRDLDAGSYKDFAPTEHDLGLPNVQTAETAPRSYETVQTPERGRGRPRHNVGRASSPLKMAENGLEIGQTQLDWLA